MRAGLAILAAFSVYALACAPAAAACYGTNSKTKQRQAVHEIYRGTHPKRYFAQATHDPGTGRPQIIYYSRYSAAPAYFKRFVRHHECCHHMGNSNEIAANCCALRRMHLSSSGLAALRAFDTMGLERLPVVDPRDRSKIVGWASQARALSMFNKALIQASVEEHR